jgi:hypothetical protein
MESMADQGVINRIRMEGTPVQVYASITMRLGSEDPRVQWQGVTELKTLAKKYVTPPAQLRESLGSPEALRQLREQEAQKILSGDLLTNLARLIARIISAIPANKPFSQSVFRVALDNVCTLLKLSPSIQQRLTATPECFPSLVRLLRHARDEIRIYACRALWCIMDEFPPAQERVLHYRGIHALHQLVSGPQTAQGEIEYASGAIWAAARDHRGIQAKFRDLGTIPVLINLLISPTLEDRTLFCLLGALSSLLWKCSENQDIIPGTKLFQTLKAFLIQRIPDLAAKTSIQSSSFHHIFVQLLELVSAATYLHPENRKAFVDSELVDYVVFFLSCDSIVVRVQAASVIYSCCIDEPVMQVYVGISHKGIVESVKSLVLPVQQVQLIDTFSGLIALGSMLKLNPECHSVFYEVLKVLSAQAPQSDLRLVIMKLIQYLRRAEMKEASKFPTVIEALYNITANHSVGGRLVATPVTEVIPFLLGVIQSQRLYSPIKTRAADLLRVIYSSDNNVAKHPQISEAAFKSLIEIAKNSPDRELSSSLCAALCAIAYCKPSEKDKSESTIDFSHLISNDAFLKLLESASSA